MSQYQDPGPIEAGLQRNGCRGKMRYTSKRRAGGARRVLMQLSLGTRTFNVYKCRACTHWHVGGSGWHWGELDGRSA